MERESTLEQLCTGAQEWLDANNLPQAIAYYKKALALEPDNIKVWVELIYAYEQLGDIPQAIAGYERILTIEPNNLYACSQLAAAHHEAGSFALAASYYEQALTIDTHDIMALHNLGYVYNALKRYDEERALYERRLLDQPDNTYIIKQLAALLLERKEYEQAYLAYVRVLELEPTSILAYCKLGYICNEHLDRYEEAKGYCELLIRLDPRNSCGHYTLGRSYYLLKQYGQALACYEQAHAIYSQLWFVIDSIGEVYEALGDKNTAAIYYRQAFASAPDSYQQELYEIATEYMRVAKYALAIELLERILWIVDVDDVATQELLADAKAAIRGTKEL